MMKIATRVLERRRTPLSFFVRHHVLFTGTIKRFFAKICPTSSEDVDNSYRPISIQARDRRREDSRSPLVIIW